MSADEQQLSMIRRAVGGDIVALTVVLTESRAKLLDYLQRRIPPDLKGTVDADDLAQEAHVEVFRHIGDFELRGPDSLDRWVATIALRKLRDAIKMRRADRRGGGKMALSPFPRHVEDSMVALLDVLAVTTRTPSQSAVRHEVVAAVQDALAELPEDYRQAIWMVHIEGRSAAAAAEQMGRTERAIHNLCYKAKARLRERLGSDSRFMSSSG